MSGGATDDVLTLAILFVNEKTINIYEPNITNTTSSKIPFTLSMPDNNTISDFAFVGSNLIVGSPNTAGNYIYGFTLPVKQTSQPATTILIDNPPTKFYTAFESYGPILFVDTGIELI
jgi:hypothetical protein